MAVQGLIEQLKEVLNQQLQESYELGQTHQKANDVFTIQWMARKSNDAAVISFVGKVRAELSK